MSFAALPRLGVGISAEPGSAAAGIDATTLPDGWVHFLEYGSDVERGLDEHVRRWAAAGRPTTYHFLDVNLEEPDDLDARWMAATAAAAREVGAAWLCGDAGLWHFGPRDRGHQLLLPPILTRDSALAVAESIVKLSEATGFAVLPENPPGTFYLGDLHVLDYFALVSERAGCGLLLDCAHLAIFQRLRGLPPTAGLDAFPLERVVELHVAGGTEIDVDGLPLVDDTHAPEPLADTWTIFDAVVARARNLRAVVYECEKNRPDEVAANFARLNRAFPRMSHLAAQRAVVRMLFDPAFAEAARRDPDRVLAALDPALRRQLAALDDRALRQDKLRRRRTLRTLSEELKASTTLALAETRRLASLDDFFCSAAFHRAVEERGSLCLAFAAFLAELPSARPELRAVLAIETALARARRDTEARPPGQVATAPGVVPISTTRGAMAALQTCERYLFEVGLMPAVALCDDAPPLALPPWDATPLELVTVPLESGVTLVEIEPELAQLLRCLPGDRARVLKDAAARGVAHAAERLDELIADEIVVT